MEYHKRLDVVCRDKCYKNESDEELKKGRADMANYGEGYDASVCFGVFIENKCILCDFNLFGLNVSYTFDCCEDNTDEVLAVIKVIRNWFEGKKIDDISEDFYRRIEEELGKKIYDKMVELGTIKED